LFGVAAAAAAAATANKQPLLYTSLFEEEYKSQINQNFGTV